MIRTRGIKYVIEILMTNELYKKLKLITQKITKGDELNEDLFHDVLIQLASNNKYNELNDKQKIYYFVRAVTNQYYSTTSYYFKTYKKIKIVELNIDIIKEDEPYEETPSVEWINKTLDDELLKNPNSWYNIGLFRLYMELNNINQVHKKTTIPKYSVRMTIKLVKELLNKKWEEYKNGTN
jgi:hypothetical protein